MEYSGKTCGQVMCGDIMTWLDRPSRIPRSEILCSENANFALSKNWNSRLKNGNSALRKCKFGTQKLHWCSKETSRIFALTKWNQAVPLKWKSGTWNGILCSENEIPPYTMEIQLFHTKSGNSALRHISQNSSLNSAIQESWTDWFEYISIVCFILLLAGQAWHGGSLPLMCSWLCLGLLGKVMKIACTQLNYKN